MFCHKCGSESIEGSAFCQKCGAKLISDVNIPKAVKPATVIPESIHTTQPQASIFPESEVKKKKKSKKLIFGAGGAALLIVIAIVIAITNGIREGDTDLFQIAEGVSPMTDSGFNATYGDVFRWLMTDRGTRLEQQGDATNLTYSGKVTGGDYPVTVVLRVTGLGSDDARVIPYAMTLNGNEVSDFNDPQGVLSDLFWAHDNRNDYPTFMDFVEWDNENAFGTFRELLDGQYGDTAATASPGSNLIGQWKPVSDDIISFFNPLDTEFFPDGTVVAKGNISDIIGLWTDSGDGQLSVTDEAGDTYMFNYEISANSLTLTDSDGDSSTFMRTGGASAGEGVSGEGGAGESTSVVFDGTFESAQLLVEEWVSTNSLPYDKVVGNDMPGLIAGMDGDYYIFNISHPDDDPRYGMTYLPIIVDVDTGEMFALPDDPMFPAMPMDEYRQYLIERGVIGNEAATGSETYDGTAASAQLLVEWWLLDHPLPYDQLGEAEPVYVGGRNYYSFAMHHPDYEQNYWAVYLPIFVDAATGELFAASPDPSVGLMTMDEYYQSLIDEGIVGGGIGIEPGNSTDAGSPSDAISADGQVISVGNQVYKTMGINAVGGIVTGINGSSVEVEWVVAYETGIRETAIYYDQFEGYSFIASNGATFYLFGLETNNSASDLSLQR